MNSAIQKERAYHIYWTFGWLYDVTKAITILYVAVTFTTFFLGRVNFVQGDSMAPSFESGDALVIDRLTYRLGEPKRGEVVSFTFPGSHTKMLIKRIVGLPNERVSIKDGRTYINDRLIAEFYLPAGTKTTPDVSYTLAANEYYMLGDNRDHSLDSRTWGGIPRDYFIGRVIFKLAVTH